jgi:hypothetical protein
MTALTCSSPMVRLVQWASICRVGDPASGGACHSIRTLEQGWSDVPLQLPPLAYDPTSHARTRTHTPPFFCRPSVVAGLRHHRAGAEGGLHGTGALLPVPRRKRAPLPQQPLPGVHCSRRAVRSLLFAQCGCGCPVGASWLLIIPPPPALRPLVVHAAVCCLAPWLTCCRLDGAFVCGVLHDHPVCGQVLRPQRDRVPAAVPARKQVHHGAH